jgi:hypothetical protein
MPFEDDDELPPYYGELLRDATARMQHRALYEDDGE